jgi:hypothetical protein
VIKRANKCYSAFHELSSVTYPFLAGKQNLFLRDVVEVGESSTALLGFLARRVASQRTCLPSL